MEELPRFKELGSSWEYAATNDTGNAAVIRMEIKTIK